MVELPGGAARRRRRRDRRLGFLRSFASDQGWAVEPALPAVVTRHPVPRLLEAGPAAADLVVGGPWRGHRAQLATVLVRPRADRPSRGHPPDDVLLLAALEVPPVRGRYVAVVAAGGLDTTGSSADLEAVCSSVVLRAVTDGVLGDGDCVALGESSMAVVGSWRDAVAHPDALDAWFELLELVAERVLGT